MLLARMRAVEPSMTLAGLPRYGADFRIYGAPLVFKTRVVVAMESTVLELRVWENLSQKALQKERVL